jgi:hypothetical protein
MVAVTDDAGHDDPTGQPDYWQIDLQMCFDDAPALLGLDRLAIQDTGFSFAPIGPERTVALARARTAMERYPQLRAALRATPVSSTLSLDQAC